MPRISLPSISLKLKLSFLVLASILALALVGLGGWSGISRVGQALDVLSEHKLPASIQLGTIRGQIAVLLQASLEVATREQDTTAQPSFKKALESKRVARKTLESAVKEYAAQELSSDELAAWQAFDKALQAWLKDDQVNEVIGELAENTDEDMQGTLFGKFKIRIFDWSSALEIVNRTQATLIEASLKASQIARAQSVASEQNAIKFMLWAFGLAVVFTLALALRIVLGVTRPLGALRDAIVSIAQQRDFTRRAPMGAKDETGQTVAAFNVLLDAVQASLRTVLEEAAQIAESAAAAQEASRRVADASGLQSESAASMAAAMEEMSVSINLIGSGSQDARDRAKNADGAADDGGRIIADSHREMEEIAAAADQSSQTILALRQQSDRISGVLQVIQELADQTNLLALNAAIEAARAGEQGRGFAVVADEVRKLAERTKLSTSEIAATIDGMQQSAREAVSSMERVEQRVSSGKQLSAQAAECMSSIRESIAKASEAIADISGAIGEQNQATHAIAAQVENVARMSEDNSLVAQDTSRIAEALSTRAEALREAVNQFRV
ncbi:MAG: MCP four helix bundle domain-containing protein [Uliginosibacterium sp.]|nr:MCP four helix bundle domain-containing protein [Uliginosibacterium sp.]